MSDPILIEAQSKANMGALKSATKDIDALDKAMADLGKEQGKMARSADKATDAMDDMQKEAKGLKGALGSIAGMGVAGIFGGLAAGAVGGAMAASDWISQVDRMATRMSITAEEASAMATAFKLAGVEAEDALSEISGFQGGLLGEIEAQKEAAKEVAAIEKERAQVLKELGDMETQHLATIADLEAERANISNEGIAERIAERDKELSKLAADHSRTMAELREQEEKENERYAEIWQERVREYEKNALKLRENFEDKARNARNFREFREAQDQYKKQQDELTRNLQDEKKKHESAHSERISDLEASRQRESEIFAERSAEISQAAADDVASLQEANAQALADLDTRIEEEKAAYADSAAAAKERLGELAEAQREAADAGGPLMFAMKQLGVEIFDANGNLRSMDELLWDIDEAFENMPDGAEKAAISADLGFEELLPVFDDGKTKIDAISDAQRLNLEVSDEMVQKNRDMLQAQNELEAQMIGLSLQLAEDTNAFESYTAILESLNVLLTAMNEAGIFTAIGESIKWMAEQVKNALQMAVDLREAWDNMVSAMEGKSLSEIFGAVGGAVEGQFGINLAGAGNTNPAAALASMFMPQFESGGIVPGSGPVPIVAHGGEMVIPREQVAMLRSGNGGATVNINAPVYGVNDLQAAIVGAIEKSDRRRLQTGVN